MCQGYLSRVSLPEGCRGAIREDILNSDLIKHPHNTASLLSRQYFNTLCNILDRHLPVNRKKEPFHPDKGFMNSDILSAKRLKQKYEHVCCRDKSTVNRMWLLTTIIIYLKCLDAGTIPWLLLKTMGIPRLCGKPNHVSPKNLSNSIEYFFSVTK